MPYKYIFLFSVLISIQSEKLFARNYYVDPSSTSTSMTGDIIHPWKNITQLNNNASLVSAGDTIFFRRGFTYEGRLNIARSGTVLSPIVYTNYGVGPLPEFDNAFSGIIILRRRQYIIIDGIKITDHSIDGSDHTIEANIGYAINIDNSPNCAIKNCDISLVGVGISVTIGSDNTTISGNYFHNMRMVRNTPVVINNNDDFGANPIVLGSSYNNILNNKFEECWADSYDYRFDGGVVELFGAVMNNNTIMYNTAINCNGFLEIGSNSNGIAQNNIVAYNKVINCGAFGVFQTGSLFTVNVSNLQYYNNTVIETAKKFSRPAELFWMSGIGTIGMVILKNNIFWLSSGVDFSHPNFNSGQLVHSNNIYRMSSGSIDFSINPNEYFSRTENLFSSVVGEPEKWIIDPSPESIAIDYGVILDFKNDFNGKPIIGIPDAGILESSGASLVSSVRYYSEEIGLKILANPIKEKLTVRLSPAAGKLRFDILDPLGQIIYRGENINVSAGVRNKDFDLSTTQNGVYILRVSNNEKSYFMQFIKQ